MQNTIVWAIATAGACIAACSLDLDPAPEVIHARFDPDDAVIPMPSNVVRDDDAGRLDLPLDGELTASERHLYEQLNQMDGWSSASAITVELDGVIEPTSVDADTLQVWKWGDIPVRAETGATTIAADGKTITVDAPRSGWDRGATYVALLRGGPAGIRGARGERIECDAAFYFLRLEEPLDTPEHERAYPGNTAEERRDNATKLEQLRVELAPYFDFFELRGIARNEVAALWAFTITDRVELAMDKASQRMPLPIDLLIDPGTGRVDLPPAPWDSETVLSAKARLAELDGFGTSAKLLVQLTGRVTPASVTNETVELWRLGDGDPVRLPVSIELLPDHQSIEIAVLGGPLAEATTYAVVVKQRLMADDGTGPVVAMPLGHLLRSPAPVFADNRSQVGVVEDVDARKVERVRAAQQAFLARRSDASDILAAWTFTTQSITEPIEGWMDKPAELGTAVDPVIERRQSPGAAMDEFPLAIGWMESVDEVVHGTIESPIFLDERTRAWRIDGGHVVDNIAFTAVVPDNASADQPLGVVIFGHAIMTERRMVLALGQALASRGLAAVAIDLPFHGTRTYCWSEGPLSIPNPTTGELTPLGNPCTEDATCREDGACIAASGERVPLRNWPILPMPMASGAAFLEIEHIANSRDHFRQAQVDLAALLRSLTDGDWQPVFGAPIDRERIFYAGQSLGGILGATFTALEPGVSDAVLNVPGADTVDMFTDSPFFGQQITAFFKREGVEPDSFDGYRFLNVARWFMDGVDPHSFADRLVARPGASSPRRVLLQMATLDFIIPNDYTRVLEELSGAVRRDYIAEHGFLVIPFEPEYTRGTRNLADFLVGELEP